MLDRTKLNLSFVTETMHVTPLLPSRETLSDPYRKVNISSQTSVALDQTVFLDRESIATLASLRISIVTIQ